MKKLLKMKKPRIWTRWRMEGKLYKIVDMDVNMDIYYPYREILKEKIVELIELIVEYDDGCVAGKVVFQENFSFAIQPGFDEIPDKIGEIRHFEIGEIRHFETKKSYTFLHVKLEKI